MPGVTAWPSAVYALSLPAMTNDHARTIDIVCDAIAGRHRLALAYRNEIRIVEPYILGYDDKETLLLSAVQVLGGSGGSGGGFRTFAADDIASLAAIEQKFVGNHPAYNARDRLFVRVLCQI